MNKVVKYILIGVGVLLLIPITFFILGRMGVDMSPMIIAMNASEDKAKRTSPTETISTTIGATNVSLTYSRPSAKGREVFGKLVPFGEIWRTGANEATSISFDKDVKIAGQLLKAGKYQLFTIPNADKWSIIFNSKSNQWGAFFYDAKSDVLRVEVPSEKSDAMVEKLTLAFESTTNTGLSIAWEKTKVLIPITE